MTKPPMTNVELEAYRRALLDAADLAERRRPMALSDYTAMWLRELADEMPANGLA